MAGPQPGGSFRRFFFQAEDGIRDDLVTGVQTCALPISIATFFLGKESRDLSSFNHDTAYGLTMRQMSSKFKF